MIGKGRDSDGIIRRIEFNFGDNTSQNVDITNGETNRDTISSVTHTYNYSGEYTASVRVKDNSGQNNEWSSVPESCKVRISVQGQVLGTTSYTPPTSLPKSGISEWLTVGFAAFTSIGTGLKFWSKKLRDIR